MLLTRKCRRDSEALSTGFMCTQYRGMRQAGARTGYDGASSFADTVAEAARKCEFSVGNPSAGGTHYADLNFHAQ